MEETDPDVERMLALRGGDEAAFDALFARWSGPLARFLERMVGDTATAEELVQETFLRVYGARERYSPEARFSTWIFRIASNLALNELRRPRRRHPHRPTDPTDVSGDGTHDERGVELAHPGPRADDLAEDRRRARALEQRLGELPERQRMALWLSSVEGLSYVEVADALETTPASVKALVHRARATLVAGQSGSGGGVRTRDDRKRRKGQGGGPA